MKGNSKEKVLQLLHERGILRPCDLDEFGIPRITLYRLRNEGQVERISRGMYRLPGGQVTEHFTLAEVAKKVPRGVVCLFTALRFHELTTQNPYQVWMAIGRKTRRPRIKGYAVRFVRFSEQTLAEGVENHIIEGVSVSIYNPAKTVADCFKYRNKIGLDVALEALKECRRSRKCDIDSLWRYAKICRVSNVMQPYLEAVFA